MCGWCGTTSWPNGCTTTPLRNGPISRGSFRIRRLVGLQNRRNARATCTGLAGDFAHAVRPWGSTAWARSREAGVTLPGLHHAILPTLLVRQPCVDLAPPCPRKSSQPSSVFDHNDGQRPALQLGAARQNRFDDAVCPRQGKHGLFPRRKRAAERIGGVDAKNLQGFRLAEKRQFFERKLEPRIVRMSLDVGIKLGRRKC